MEHGVLGGHDVLESTAAGEIQEGTPTGASATQADCSSELFLALRHTGIVEGQLLSLMHMPQGVYGNRQAAPASHHNSLAVGTAAVAHATGHGTLHNAGYLTSCMVLGEGNRGCKNDVRKPT